MDNKYMYGFIGVVLGAAAGAGIGWYISKKQYEAIMADELVQIKNHYDISARREKTGPYSKIEDLARQLREDNAKEYKEGLKRLGYSSEEEAEEDPKFDRKEFMQELGIISDDELIMDEAPISNDIPEQEDEDEDTPDDGSWNAFDYSHQNRDPEIPYVISYEEFSEEHLDFNKNTITWFDGDETLTDEREEVIPEVVSYVGEDALTRFGDGSHDENIVYVRNERMGVDFEVVLNKGKYSVIVLHKPEPKKRAPRKMKVTD